MEIKWVDVLFFVEVYLLAQLRQCHLHKGSSFRAQVTFSISNDIYRLSLAAQSYQLCVPLLKHIQWHAYLYNIMLYVILAAILELLLQMEMEVACCHGW